MTPTTRRAFVKGAALSVLTLGLGGVGGPSFLHRAALAAQSGPRRKVLVTLFQRGAMDGLAAVCPLEESHLRRLRPNLAMSAARSAGDGALIDLRCGFGLHPSLDSLAPLFDEGSLAVVHATGSPNATRSHFDAQDYMESGTPGRKGTPDGWLNRVVGELGHEPTPFQAVAMTSALPRSLYGEEPALAVSRLKDFEVRVPGARQASRVAGNGFEALWEQASAELLRDTGEDTFEAVEVLSGLDVDRYRPAAGVRYPSSPLGEALRQIAFLVKSDVGLEVAFAESGGWDTHVRQGTATGSFAQRATDLAESIAAFWHDLGQHRDEVVVMTMTEFGRTVRQNGSGGTDHGHGSCLFLLGTGVDGGKVHGDFPGLDPDVLYEGRDLPVTTDFRTVFAEVAQRHLGVADRAALFPGWSGSERIRLFA